MKKILNVEGMTCQHCVNRVKKIIEKHEGVSEVEVDLESKEARFSIRDQSEDVVKIVTAITDFGFKAAEKV
jgi:copper chaperone